MGEVPFGPINSEFRPLVAIGGFSPLNFKNYLLFEFRSHRKSNVLRLKPLKNYIDLTHQKFKVLRFQEVDRFLNFLHIQIYALRWWILYHVQAFSRCLGLDLGAVHINNGSEYKTIIKVHVRKGKRKEDEILKK